MKINGKEYTERELDFNMVCDLSDMGINLYAEHISMHPLLRAYLAICGGISKAEAGQEIQEHVLAGGDLTELQAAFHTAMDNSGFFKALQERAQKNA